MGLYNLAMGTNPMAGTWLSMLELTPGDVGRFRDAWLEDGEHGLIIVIHTRNGGGNREEYQPVFDRLAQHPQYVSDSDCDYDCTYADIRFTIPSEHVDNVQQFVTMAEGEGKRDVVVDNRTQAEKWDGVIAKMGTGRGD